LRLKEGKTMDDRSVNAAKSRSPDSKPTRWIARARPKIGRIACPSLARLPGETHTWPPAGYGKAV
jgi:hypothetical protein